MELKNLLLEKDEFSIFNFQSSIFHGGTCR